MVNKAETILRAGIQNKTKFKKFLSAYITFFFIPLVVCFMKIYKLTSNLITHMNPFSLSSVHRLVFVIIIMIYLYGPIKQDLDEPFGFPYSYIYIGVCVFTVLLISKGIKV
jgi:putative effector of murein hydrolase LrgA (UPF0299 family)